MTVSVFDSANVRKEDCIVWVYPPQATIMLPLSKNVQLSQGPTDGHRLSCRTKLAMKAA
jgi:hypothetical protein